MELAALLAIPLLGAALLGLWGAHARAATLNAVFSLATFLAACLLTVRVIGTGPFLWGYQQF